MTAAQILVAVAGLMGASGVALSAAGAHGPPEANLGTAGSMLLFHAAAVIAVVGARGAVPSDLGLWAAAGLALGATIFAGDLALRAYAGTRLFPMAAPTGGIVLMLSWVALALAALLGGRG